jgi:anti-sigma B factor antagonist
LAARRDRVDIDDLGELKIVTRGQGTTMTIELAGEWDLAGVPAVRRAIAHVLSGCPESVVLDLSRLVFIDSSGLHATIELAHRSSAQGIRLVIICGPPSVHRVFTITGLTERLPFVDQPPISQSSGRRIRAWTARSGTSYSAVRRVHVRARIPGS